jgi:hypothetical protein
MHACIETTDWTVTSAKEIVPKLGSKTEKAILEKLKQKSKGKTVGDFASEEGIKIWYHNAPRYWIHAHTDEYLPKIEYYDSCKKEAKTNRQVPIGLRETKASSHYKSLTFSSKHVPIVLGLLNSSLFYWWFVAWSDGRDLLTQHINSFYIDLGYFPKVLEGKLESLGNRLMESYDKTSNPKINVRKGGYVVKIKEIIPQKSKVIIDQIDDIFADYYELTEVEKRFIRDFDIEFRVESD